MKLGNYLAVFCRNDSKYVAFLSYFRVKSLDYLGSRLRMLLELSEVLENVLKA